MRMSDKPRRSISVGRAATVDDLNAGWELAHETMHFGFLRESPAMKTLSNVARGFRRQ